MSWFSQYLFDPIKAAIARAESSSNPVAQAVGAASSTAYQKISADVTGTNATQTANSAAGVGNQAIKDFEDGLTEVADVFITAGLGLAGPIGASLAPEAVLGANVILTFGEQHALTFISSLFSHAKTQVASIPAPATAPANPQPPPPIPS